MNAVQFLLEEHQKVKARFADIDSADPQQRGQMWQQLQPELKIHEEIEDTYLYGPVSKDPAAQGTKAAGFLEHQDKDVRDLEQIMQRLSQQEPTSASWLNTLHEVRDTLMQHVQEEEGEIFPEIQQIWDRDKLDMSGRQMQEAKQEAMQNPRRWAEVLTEQPSQVRRSR
jgi:hemerythrin-like domain-containing protein